MTSTHRACAKSHPQAEGRAHAETRAPHHDAHVIFRDFVRQLEKLDGRPRGISRKVKLYGDRRPGAA